MENRSIPTDRRSANLPESVWKVLPGKSWNILLPTLCHLQPLPEEGTPPEAELPEEGGLCPLPTTAPVLDRTVPAVPTPRPTASSTLRLHPSPLLLVRGAGTQLGGAGPRGQLPLTCVAQGWENILTGLGLGRQEQ